MALPYPVDEDGFGPEDVLSTDLVSRETLARVAPGLAILRDQSEVMNLLSRGDRARVWRRHVLDSAAIVAEIPGDARVVDIGAGSGFPSLLLLAQQADGGRLTSVESSAKKARYLEAALGAIGGVFHVKHSRMEVLNPEPVDVVTARAVASLDTLLGYAAPWVKKGGVCVFPKGVNYKDELTTAKENWNFESEIKPNRASENGVILMISSIEKRKGRP